jgi:TetR/AcrR family transcriptional repressor of nem operon
LLHPSGVARVREFDTEAAVQAAMQVFWCRGFEATSVQDLVDATGVGRGSLYAAFGSKEGLYLAALDRYREQLAAPMLAAVAGGRPIRTVVRDVLLQLVEEAVTDPDRRGCLMVNAATERMAHDPAVAGRVRDTLSAMEDALTEALLAAQDAGQATRERSARDLARFLVLTVQGLRVMGVVTPDRRALRASVEVALRCLD